MPGAEKNSMESLQGPGLVRMEACTHGRGSASELAAQGSSMCVCEQKLLCVPTVYPPKTQAVMTISTTGSPFWIHIVGTQTATCEHTAHFSRVKSTKNNNNSQTAC